MLWKANCDMEHNRNIFVQRCSIASICFVLLAAITSYSLHKFNLFTAGILIFGTICSVFSLVANVATIFACRSFRTIHSVFAAVFAIVTYLLVFGYSGRSVLWEIHQYRRDKWFFEVGKPKYESYVSNNTNYLGKVERELRSDIPDVRVFGKRNEDGTVDMQFVFVGGVPRQGYLYHTGERDGAFPRQFISVKMITNQWYDVAY